MLRAPDRLQCDLADAPLALSHAEPRLSWWVNDPRPAEVQSAYEIIAATSEQGLLADQGDLWMSGRVDSDQCAWVAYRGLPLVSRQRVWWKVRTFDSDGVASPWSDPAYFETGLLHPVDWQAQWITTPLRGSLAHPAPVPALRREFVLVSPVRRARLYVCVLGDYQIEINGERITQPACNASWSQFDFEAYYHSYDVTKLLLAEPNCIGVLLSDGFYAGEMAGSGRGHYGDRAQLCLQLEVECENGERVVVCTDETWLWHPSWLVAAEINNAEHVDRRQYVPGWSEAGLEDRQWQPVLTLPPPQRLLRAQSFPDVTTRAVVRPQATTQARVAGGRAYYELEFAQHMLGRAVVRVLASATDTIRVTYASSPSFDETISEVVTDTFTLIASGEHPQLLQPEFALHSFRYLRVEMTAGVSELLDAQALRMGAAALSAVDFRCDHPTLNQLFEALDNSVSCVALPQPARGVAPTARYPDLAYAGCWIPAMAFRPDLHGLFAKWLSDEVQAITHFEARYKARAVPRWVTLSDAPDVDEVACIEALANGLWEIFRFQGDIRLLHQAYGVLRSSALGFRHQFNDRLRHAAHGELYGGAADADLAASCTTLGAIAVIEKIARALGHVADVTLLQREWQAMREAIRRRYLTRDGHLAASSQSGLVAALYHGVLEATETRLAQDSLIELLRANGYHADVGPALLHALLPVLTRVGRLDVAYMVLVQTSLPSWLGALSAGATLIGQQPDRTELAHCGLWEWLLQALIGISVDEPSAHVDPADAMRQVRIRPMPPLGKRFLAGAPVQFVEARLDTLRGAYQVHWHIHEAYFELQLTVPPGCTARVIMPDGIEQRVSSGEHRFVMDFDAGGDGVPTLLELAQVRDGAA